jgi:hypothetical protein
VLRRRDNEVEFGTSRFMKSPVAKVIAPCCGSRLMGKTQFWTFMALGAFLGAAAGSSVLRPLPGAPSFGGMTTHL